MLEKKAFEHCQVYQDGLLLELWECLLGPGYVVCFLGGSYYDTADS